MPNDSLTGSQYPQDLPVKSVTTLISIIRDGEIDAKKDRFAKEVYWLTGFGLKIVLGDPDAIQPVGASKAELSDALLELEGLLHEAIAVSKAGFNWTIIVALVQLLLSILGDDEE